MLARRTWFFTGTFRNQTHDLEETKVEVTKFLGRLRERARYNDDWLRYLMLPELHKSGAIHYHGLLHCGGKITGKMVRQSWRAGFSFPSLVKSNAGASSYVTKYCTKDMFGESIDERGRSRRPRIRASQAPTYGEMVIIRDEELVRQLAAEAPKQNLSEIWRKNLIAAVEAIKEPERQTLHRTMMEMQAIPLRNR
jgi:hypothetical protein